MKILLLLSFISTIDFNKTLNESFILGVVTSGATILKFNDDGKYEYFTWREYSGKVTLEKGDYKFDGKVIILECSKCSKMKQIIPKKLFYNKVSAKKFSSNNFQLFAIQENFTFWRKRYLILSEEKLEIH